MTRVANLEFAEFVAASFNKQNAMHLIRATLPVVEHGRTEIHVPHWDGVEQQHGFVHGGVTAPGAVGLCGIDPTPTFGHLLADRRGGPYSKGTASNVDDSTPNNSESGRRQRLR
ncbi:MAG TPA: hypothetical protein VE860_21985 [Chthoniobacterales bacterium]|nr:hypothetical protein [Chthoniobacterales bacterium]